MNTTGEYIDTDTFDREYTLDELLPAASALSLLERIGGGIVAAVVFPGGAIHCRTHPVAADYGDLVQASPAHPAPRPMPFRTAAHTGMCFPLTHELETIGFLIVQAGAGRSGEIDLSGWGEFAAAALNRIIYLNCQLHMTAGLHGQVVAESYARLKKKAAQLARSEEKYRLLARNLEKEVERKTRKIQDTQLRLLQQEKLASIGQLAAGMAHEINNPIGFVISNLNTLRRTTREMGALIGRCREFCGLVAAPSPDPAAVSRIKRLLPEIRSQMDEMDVDYLREDTADLIDESLDGAGRVQIIVQNLRDFTHPSVDTTESVDINHCLDTTLAVLSNHGSDGVVIRREYGDLPPVRCRLREINLAFLNVLKNAFQAMDAAGEVRIRTRCADQAVTIWISDDGPGIDSAVIGRVFDPFFTTREVGDGIGLGLTQVYHSVRNHGGTVSVESTAGRGSRIVMTLPVDGQEETTNGAP